MSEQTITPDVVSVNLHRLASELVGLKDYEKGWVVSIYLALATTDHDPGKLDTPSLDVWKVAGCKSRDYWQRWGGDELVRKHFRRDEHGKLYHPRLLMEMRSK